MKRGEIWVGNLNPNRGAEAGKIRPVVIVEADWSIALPGDTVVILPMTTQIDVGMQALRPLVQPRGALRERSQVLVDQPRALDRKRLLQGPLARLNATEMAGVDRALAEILGLTSELGTTWD